MTKVGVKGGGGAYEENDRQQKHSVYCVAETFKVRNAQAPEQIITSCGEILAKMSVSMYIM